MANSFDGIVRGYQALGSLGAVIVEVAGDQLVPGLACFQELGQVTRPGDGLLIARAIQCIGEPRPCQAVAGELLDQWARVTAGGDLVTTFEPIDDQEVEGYDFLCPNCGRAGELIETEDGGEAWACGRCGAEWPTDQADAPSELETCNGCGQRFDRSELKQDARALWFCGDCLIFGIWPSDQRGRA